LRVEEAGTGYSPVEITPPSAPARRRKARGRKTGEEDDPEAEEVEAVVPKARRAWSSSEEGMEGPGSADWGSVANMASYAICSEFDFGDS
jgi:hypothetical protein